MCVRALVFCMRNDHTLFVTPARFFRHSSWVSVRFLCRCVYLCSNDHLNLFWGGVFLSYRFASLLPTAFIVLQVPEHVTPPAPGELDDGKKSLATAVDLYEVSAPRLRMIDWC